MALAASNLAGCVEAVDLAETVEVPRLVPNDPDDDHVVAAACAVRADCIVAGHVDLPSLGGFQGIRILTAAAFLAPHLNKSIKTKVIRAFRNQSILEDTYGYQSENKRRTHGF